MLFHPQVVDHPLEGVRIVGPLVQWACSLLLLGVFALLLPLTAQRRVVVTWMVAWGAQLVGVTRTAIFVCYWLMWPHSQIPFWTVALQFVYQPAHFIFLAAAGLGSLNLAGWKIPQHRRRETLLAAAVGGVLLVALPDALSAKIYLVATVVVLFGCVEAILLRADGARRRGLLFLASALALFSTVSTIYLLENYVPTSMGFFARFVHEVSFSSGYGDGAALAILACAVIVVIMQDAFLATRRAHEERVSSISMSEARLDGIIHAAREAIVTVSPEGQIELLNGAAERLLGRDRDECIGRMLSAFMPTPSLFADDSPAAATEMQSGEIRRGDGTIVPVEFTVGPIRSDEANGLVVVLRDISARRAEQAERETFERRVAETEKMLAIGRVVSGVAHELNNPLAVVLGQSEQLVDAAPPGELRAGLSLIHEQAHRARHIVRDLLAFVRHRDNPVEVINASRVVERAVASQRSAAAESAVLLQFDRPAALPDVSIDRLAIEQVLVNLIDNAIDAAGVDGIVRVGTAVGDGQVRISVEDSGPGVDDALLPRLFEPFFTTKGPGRGTGLGLSVSRSIAEQQHGSIRLDNRPQPGVGARFVLSLPVTAPGSRAAAAPVQRAMPGPPRANSEVMLIDDEPSVRTTLGKMFRRMGWAVREARNATEALTWLDGVADANAPLAILCDLKMPGMGGHDLYRHYLQSRPMLAGRFIFVTGDVIGSVDDDVVAASGRPVVEKPFTVAEIARAVELVVGQASPPR